MPVPDLKTYCAMLDGASAGSNDPRSYLALAETAMAERVKHTAGDLRATRKTMFAP